MTGLIHQTTKLVIFCILGIGAATSTLAAPLGLPLHNIDAGQLRRYPEPQREFDRRELHKLGAAARRRLDRSAKSQHHRKWPEQHGRGRGDLVLPHVEWGQVRQRDHRQRHDLKVSLCRHFHRGRRQHRFRGDGDSKRRLRRSAWGESRQPHRSRTRYPQASVARPPGRGHHGAEPTAVAGRLGTDQRDLV